MNIQEQDKKRIEFILEIYNTPGGKGVSAKGVDLLEIGEKLNLTDEMTHNIITYLKTFSLVECCGAGYIKRLTPEGWQEAEEILRSPDKETNHFQPLNITNINIGNIENSDVKNVVQQATYNSNQTLTENKPENNRIEDILSKLETHIESITSQEKDKIKEEISMIKSEIEIIKTQLLSPKPKTNIINAGLSKISSMLRSTTELASTIKPAIDTINEYLN